MKREIITIVLAISNSKVRQGIQLLLETEPYLSVIGKATNGIEALNMVKALFPKIMIMELMIGDIKDIELIKRTLKVSPDTSVIVFSLYDAVPYINEVFQAGAKAYVLKESRSHELIYAIHQVVAGHRYLSPALSNVYSVE